MRKILKFCVLATAFLCACAHVRPQTAPFKQADSYQVINLGPQFKHFWETAANKPFDEQLRVWNEIVETPYQVFYDAMVWQKKDNSKWEERKVRRLKEMFRKYPALYSRMTESFRSFEKTLSLQIGKFQNFFSDAKFSLPIYAAPTTTFNGKGGEGGDSGDALGKTVLAFGIDMMVEYDNDPDVLYSHELFHIYHTEAIGLNEHVFLEQGRLTLPLWLEGLATYVSLQMNPTAGMSAVLMDKDLPNVNDNEVRELAGKFLGEADEKAFDTKKPEIYKKWFAIDPQYNVGKNLPHRCGYLLGLRVVQELAGNHSLQEMVHWKVADVHKNVVEALRKIAAADLKNGLKPATAPGEIIPVNKNDVRILLRASEILSDTAKWNRRDDRQCSQKARKVSLYCALYRASVEINGEFDHRLGALEEIRRTVEEASKGKAYAHRLMEYNNDPTTKFSDIKDILLQTERRISRRLKETDNMTEPKEIPFSYFEKTFMVVPVEINGNVTQDFIFDTGIGVNIISQSLCHQLGCKAQGEHTGKRMSGQEVHIPMSSVGSLSLAGHGQKDVPVGLFNLEEMMPGAKIGGFLSLGFFRDLPYSVDYDRKTITFEDPSSLEKIRAEGIRVPVRFDIQGPSFGIFLSLILPNGKEASVEVDTGSQALILNEKFMDELGVKANGPDVKRKDGKDETGHMYSRFFATLKGRVHLRQSQDISMNNPEVMFQKIIYDGLVGHHFLSQFRVTYDLPHSEMIFRTLTRN